MYKFTKRVYLDGYEAHLRSKISFLLHELHVAAYFHVRSCYLIILLLPPPCNILPMADPWTHRKTLGSMPSCWHRIYTESGVVIVERFASLCRNTDTASRRKYVRLVESVKKFGSTVHTFLTARSLFIDAHFTLWSMRILNFNKLSHYSGHEV